MENNKINELSFLTEKQSNKLNILLKSLEEYDSKFESQNMLFEYGNSGFRYNADIINRLAFRVFIGSYLKSIEHEGLPLGIMITASYNRYSDNGFKIAGIDGEPIPTDWKNFYNEIVNKPNLSEFIIDFTRELYQKKNLILDFETQSSICFAIDTRPSSKNIFTIVKDSLLLLNSRFVYYEIITSPGLHFLTYLNQLGFLAHKKQKLPGKFTFFTANEYWNFLMNSNQALDKYADKSGFLKGDQFAFLKEDRKNENRYEKNILIDCANGVAGFCIEKIKNIFAKEDFSLDFINTLFKNYSFLNGFCGSDFILKEKSLPMNYPNYDKYDTKTLFTKNVSLDGDADRVVYYFKIHEDGNENNNEIKSNHVKIINGEHFKCIFSKLLDLLIENLSKDMQQKLQESIKIVTINNQYTNKAIKNYLNSLKNIKTFVQTKSGLDDIFKIAKEYDISIYYESNGKGAVYSNEATLKKLSKLFSFCLSANDCLILEFLSIFLSSFNKTCGDALSSIIVFEKCLKMLNLSLTDVYGLFEEYPNLFEYVEVENIIKFKCDEDSFKMISPLEFTKELEEFKKNIDVQAKCLFKINKDQKNIRIYVESESKENVESLVKKAKKLILDYSNN